MKDWWRGAVFYQIYPRSFCDSNNDGVGDLGGIFSKLPYLKALGVDALWLSPFFRSPMKDFGYDISDYEDVDPVFGTLDDFDALIKQAHRLGLKIIIDQVYSHTSDQHPWFRQSRQSRDHDKADWYLWADAKADGGPPNNWISVFGGQAWSWDTRRRQYYLHNFLAEQPDLNFHHPPVRRAILETARFWLERGVDGFRLDVANFYYCDQRLRDNPPKPKSEAPQQGFARPYAYQHHLHDRSQKETLAFTEELRRLMDAYDERMSVAEIYSDQPMARSLDYTQSGRLHTAYNFLFLEAERLSPALIKRAFEEWRSDEAWPSWSFSNHDVMRALTRWGPHGDEHEAAFARMLMGLLLCLRGTIFLYQGDELGLPQAHVPFERLRDPEGIRFWPDNLGRDGCRTPMPWRRDAAHAGFSKAEPWLPVDPRHQALSVEAQEADRQSTLHNVRGLIALRRQYPALRRGAIRFLDLPEPLLGFRRQYEGESLACLFNLGAAPMNAPLIKGKVLASDLGGKAEKAQITLPAYGGIIIREAAE